MIGLPGTRLVPDLPNGPRAALVIATASYEDPGLRQLRSPVRDAEDLAEILGDPGIGGFTVTRVNDADERQARRAIDRFLSGRGIGDLVVVYLSCHGILDDRNRLYFAATDTLKTQLRSTGIPSAWVLEQVEECRARRKILILDCCFSGAFAHSGKGDADLHLERRLAGNGRGQAVLTASRAGEYSFEGQALPGALAPGSVFTSGLVEGLRSGAADTNGDGYVSVDEAYAYAYDYVVRNGTSQTPQRWLSGGEGSIRLARSPAGVKRVARSVQGVSSYAARILAEVERTAHSITDEDMKAEVLTEVAVALAAADPDHAARLLTDAERTAQSITDEQWKAKALTEVAVALAAADPDHAERTAQSITDERAKAGALTEIAVALAATDPDHAARLLTDAERTAQSITNDVGKTVELIKIAKVVVKLL
jgi:hypothetical protein